MSRTPEDDVERHPVKTSLAFLIGILIGSVLVLSIVSGAVSGFVVEAVGSARLMEVAVIAGSVAFVVALLGTWVLHWTS